MLPDCPDGSDAGLNFPGPLPHSLDCGIIVIDEQRKISALNPEAEKLTGLQAGQILNHPLSSLPLPLRQIINETFSTGKPQDKPINQPGEERGESTLHITTSLAQGTDGNRLGVIVVLNDLSATRDLESKMRRLDRLASIGALSASMAHEIKNALVAVKTFLELLIKKNKDADLADVVSQELRRIDSIVSQMLKFAGPAKPILSPLHLHGVLEHSLRLVEHQLAGKKINLKKSLAASPDLVRGDSYQLEQAFLNLFLNAAEAMAPNGELAIATAIFTPAPPAPSDHRAPENAHLRLSITDSGSGIPCENISRLFDPFFTTKTEGTGLGLSITRRIIQEHGGTINVQSEVNQGTTFTILLPCAGKS